MFACVPNARLNQRHPAGLKAAIGKSLDAKNVGSKQNTPRSSLECFI